MSSGPPPGAYTRCPQCGDVGDVVETSRRPDGTRGLRCHCRRCGARWLTAA